MKRLHISPLTPALLEKYLPDQEASFHTIQTFPERPYGFVNVDDEQAANLRKKLHGAILKGQKVSVEEARKEGKQVAKPKKVVKRKRTVEAIELRDRKVVRGWDKRSGCLFRMTVNKKPAVVHEFAKTTKFPTFLKSAAITTPKTAEYIDGKGWVNENGEVIEAARQTDEARYDEQASQQLQESAQAAREVEMEDVPEKEAEEASSDNESEEMEVSAEAVPAAESDAESESDTDSESEAGSEGEVELAAEAESRGDAELEIEAGPDNNAMKAKSDAESDSESDSLGSSDSEDDVASPQKATVDVDSEFEEAASSDDSEEETVAKTIDSGDESAEEETVSKSTDSGDNAQDKLETASKESGQSPLTSTELLEPPSPAKSTDSSSSSSSSSAASTPAAAKPPLTIDTSVHPLEALYKRTGEAEVPTFSFGGDDFDSDLDDEPPATPFKDSRAMRSGAPTPDTAHANKQFTWPEPESPVKEESDFQKWFFEHRGEANRAWKSRRRIVSKTKRYRDNKRKVGKN